MASILDRRRRRQRVAQAAALFAFVAVAQAQNTDTTSNANAAATTQAANTNTNTNTQGTATGTGTPAATTAGTKAQTTAKATDLPNLSTAPTAGETTSTTAASSTPASSAATNSIFHLSDVPTIAGYGIPTAGVPVTAGAPYMQTSNLPEGTVFIIVGAFLGTLGAAILLWRATIAWSLHRSVKRANLGATDSLLKLSKPSAHFSHAAAGSDVSLERLSAPSGKLTKAHTAALASPPTASSLRNSSLFFSPTAGAGAHHATPAAPRNSSSAYLPAGYYAAPSAAAPANGSQKASIGNINAASLRLSSLNPMHPSNRGYMPQGDESPPESPGLSPARAEYAGPGATGAPGTPRLSSSYAHLTIPGGAPEGQRAPSANLEELFEHHGNGMRADR